jgi:hypothetical protein
VSIETGDGTTGVGMKGPGASGKGGPEDATGGVAGRIGVGADTVGTWVAEMTAPKLGKLTNESDGAEEVGFGRMGVG